MEHEVPTSRNEIDVSIMNEISKKIKIKKQG